MLRYQRINGVRLENTNGLPTIQRTPEGAAMGAVPGWVDLIDPDYMNVDEGWVRNRAAARSKYPNVATPAVVSQFPNGASAFQMLSGQTLRIESDAVAPAIDPTQWSVFTVCMPQPIDGGSGVDSVCVLRGQDNNHSLIGLRVDFTRDFGRPTIRTYNQYGIGVQNPARLSYNGLNIYTLSEPALVMFTGSTRDGLRIFVNGEEVAAAPSDKRPLEIGYEGGENQRAYFRGARGLFGMTGALSIDLGWAEHAGYRRAIEAFLMGKYQIGG